MAKRTKIEQNQVVTQSTVQTSAPTIAAAESEVLKKAKHIARLADHSRFDRLLARCEWRTIVAGDEVKAAIEKARKINRLLVTGDAKCTPFGHNRLQGNYVASTSLIDEWLLETTQKGNDFINIAELLMITFYSETSTARCAHLDFNGQVKAMFSKIKHLANFDSSGSKYSRYLSKKVFNTANYSPAQLAKIADAYKPLCQIILSEIKQLAEWLYKLMKADEKAAAAAASDAAAA